MTTGPSTDPCSISIGVPDDYLINPLPLLSACGATKPWRDVTEEELQMLEDARSTAAVRATYWPVILVVVCVLWWIEMKG